MRFRQLSRNQSPNSLFVFFLHINVQRLRVYAPFVFPGRPVCLPDSCRLKLLFVVAEFSSGNECHYFFTPAVQFKTTVSGEGEDSSTGITITKRWPLFVTS